MLTLKLKISNKIDVTEHCENYSYMFRKLYANFELSKDKNFQKELRTKYNLDSWIFESCRMDAETKLKQMETFAEKRNAELIGLENDLQNQYDFLSENFGKEGQLKARRSISRILKKIRSIKKDKGLIVFGGKSNLKKISYLSNVKQLEEAQKWRNIYQENRILPISVVGEMPQKGNRKCDFRLSEKTIIFKPKMGEKIEVNFYASKGQMAYLNKLQATIGEQAISIKINNDHLWITFDEQKLNNFHFDSVGWSRELKTIPKDEKELRRICTKKWYEEQRQRQLKDKIETRIAAIDLNPEYIGFCVVDGEKTIFKQVINLSKLSTKLRLSSTDEVQVYQNNKRKHEISNAWKYIFEICKHLKVAKFSMEELNFKTKGVNENAAEGNRKTKNIWHRELTINLITKYCNILGIEKVEVNPCYSSFIGNIKHDYFDPLNAALEIARRGQNKYKKGAFYPSLERTDFDTMYRLGLDVQNSTVTNWQKALKLFKNAGLRYRKELAQTSFSEINLYSEKSCTTLYNFV